MSINWNGVDLAVTTQFNDDYSINFDTPQQAVSRIFLNKFNLS